MRQKKDKIGQILSSLTRGAEYTTSVQFPSCVRSLVSYKALRRKRSKRKAEKKNPQRQIFPLQMV